MATMMLGFLFFHHTEAIEHPQMRSGVGAGKNQDNLVQVCQQHLLVFPFRQGAMRIKALWRGSTLSMAPLAALLRKCSPGLPPCNIPVDPACFSRPRSGRSPLDRQQSCTVKKPDWARTMRPGSIVIRVQRLRGSRGLCFVGGWRLHHVGTCLPGHLETFQAVIEISVIARRKWARRNLRPSPEFSTRTITAISGLSVRFGKTVPGKPGMRFLTRILGCSGLSCHGNGHAAQVIIGRPAFIDYNWAHGILNNFRFSW